MREIINNPDLECAVDVINHRYAAEIAENRIWLQFELDGNSVSGDPEAFENHAACLEKDGSVSLFTVVIRNQGPGIWTVEEIADDPQDPRCGFALQMLRLMQNRKKRKK